MESDIGKEEEELKKSRSGLDIQFSIKTEDALAHTEKYHFILAYYAARVFQADQPRQIEKVKLESYYEITEFPRKEFVKYLLDLKMTEALARNNNKTVKADEIRTWFFKLEQLLKQIFDDKTVELEFDEDTFEFHILQQGIIIRTIGSLLKRESAFAAFKRCYVREHADEYPQLQK